MRTSLPCVKPTLRTMDLNLCPCTVKSQELVHVNSSLVRGPKTLFCIAFAPTAITFAYELGFDVLWLVGKLTKSYIRK